MRVRFAIGLCLLGLLACEVPFDPKGDFLDRVVVFGILSPQKTVHVVRLSTTYDPPQFNPLDNTNSNQISNATVTITVNAVGTVLRDSVFQRNDTSRYQDSIRAFVYTAGTIQRGVPYSLSAVIPGYGTLTASTTPPSSGTIEIENDSRPTLTNPDVNRSDVMFFAIPANNAEAHALRVFLEYEVPTLNPGVLVKEEVPLFTTNYEDCLTYDAVYPQVRRRQQVAGREIWMLPYVSYQRAILKILKSNEGHVVNFKRAMVVMIQTDKHLYSYFSLIGGFRDEFSIRVDEPNYTNVEGGLGFFGSFTADSLSVTLPLSFPKISCP